MAGLTSSEEYDAELERMNATMTAENLALQHDNKQLNTLIKEYETTLETIMGLFRQRAVSGIVVILSLFLCTSFVWGMPDPRHSSLIIYSEAQTHMLMLMISLSARCSMPRTIPHP